MLRRVKLTDIRVGKLPFQEGKRKLYWDLDLIGFGLRVGATTKSFFCEKRVLKKTVRITIGRYPIMTTAKARDIARVKLLDMTLDIDPRTKRPDQTRIVTFGEVVVEFFASRSLKPSTLKGYNQVLNKTYGDWHHLPITDVSKDMIEDKHKKLTRLGKEPYANLCSRTIRSVINFAIAKYEDDKGDPIIPRNPVDRISAARLWNRPKRRTGNLKPHLLKPWFKEVDGLSNDVVRDFLKFTLFTGVRKAQGSSLRWSDTSMENRSFIIRGPKNHIDMEIPMSDQIYDILIGRQTGRQTGSEFVFPSKHSESRHIEEPKKLVFAVGDAIGYHFTIHDLRRTFVTFAESLDISQYAVKALVNHKMSDSDVTAGYVVISVDRLRAPMQRISDYIMKSSQD